MKKEASKRDYIVVGLSIIFAIIVILMVNLRDGEKKNQEVEKISLEKNTKIVNILDYGDLNESDIKIVNLAMKDLNLIYLYRNKELIFAYNISDYCPRRLGIECNNIGGKNLGNGTSIIQFLNDIDYLQKKICHELLHTTIKIISENPYEDPNHAMIYQLGELKVCFNSEGEKYTK